jgi:ubiquinone/menaquinone biosynthesis C-methylase UbiE
MNPKNFKKIQRNYDQLSSIYDFLSGRAELAVQRRVITFLNERKIERLLDIGCGTGRPLNEYRKSIQNMSLPVGMDLSFKMCRKALLQNNKITCANGIDLPFSNTVFDAVVFSFSLEIFPEDLIRNALIESVRVLKPDGVVCIVCMAKTDKRNVISNLYLWAHQKFPNVVDCRPISTIQLLKESGFMIIKKESLGLWGLPVEIVLAKK